MPGRVRFIKNATWIRVITHCREKSLLAFEDFRRTGKTLRGEFRGVDLLSPVWNLFDLLPSGRGDWMPGRDY